MRACNYCFCSEGHSEDCIATIHGLKALRSYNEGYSDGYEAEDRCRGGDEWYQKGYAAGREQHDSFMRAAGNNYDFHRYEQ